MFSFLAKTLNVDFLANAVYRGLSVFVYNNLTRGPAVVTGLMTLTLFQVHRYGRIINCKFFLDSCPV